MPVKSFQKKIIETMNPGSCIVISHEGLKCRPEIKACSIASMTWRLSTVSLRYFLTHLSNSKVAVACVEIT